MTKKRTRTRKEEHYVNNKQFSEAVRDYVLSCIGVEDPPIISNYIGDCFIRIAEGLSHKPNFINYTYRDDMVANAIENCVKAIRNFNIEAKTRTGLPNAFAYFTQISYYAFLRKIAEENKQSKIRVDYIEYADLKDVADVGESNNAPNSILDSIKKRNNSVDTNEKPKDNPQKLEKFYK